MRQLFPVIGGNAWLFTVIR